MSRCTEFYTKWEKDPNWCEKCKSSVRQINKYIDLLDELEERGIDKERTIVCLPEGVARPLFAIQNSEIRDKVILSVQNSIESKKDEDTGKFTSGKLSMSDVTKIIRNVTHEDKVVTQPIPNGKFDVIYADPPWEYSNTGFSMSVENKYPTMSIEKLCEMDIKSKSEDNAVLFLWVTNPQLELSMKIINSWGFEYKTNFVWIKKNHTAGFYVFGQHELLLIATKGSMLPEDKRSSIITGDNSVHSKKPEEVYSIIERMYPNKRCLELFARNKHSGWESWGNEV